MSAFQNGFDQRASVSSVTKLVEPDEMIGSGRVGGVGREAHRRDQRVDREQGIDRDRRSEKQRQQREEAGSGHRGDHLGNGFGHRSFRFRVTLTLTLTPTLSRKRERGNPFSRLREKVAPKARPDEGLRRQLMPAQHARYWAKSRAIATSALLALVIGLTATQNWTTSRLYYAQLGMADQVSLGKWIDRNVPADASLLIGPANPEDYFLSGRVPPTRYLLLARSWIRRCTP